MPDNPPGMTRLAHLEDNLGAARGRLPDAAIRARMEKYWDQNFESLASRLTTCARRPWVRQCDSWTEGNGTPRALVRTRSTRWFAVMNSVELPSPPQATLAVGTPVRMRPSRVASGAYT